MLLRLVVATMLLFGVAACGAEGSASPSPSPVPSIGPVTTPEAAIAAVVAHEPRLAGITERDLDMIGQSAYWEAMPASGVGAFLVRVYVGWGDCQAGCINEHSWVYAVGPDGSVTLQSEGGDPVPPDAWPSPGGDGRTGLLITATAGPTCPVVTDPPDPACADRPVAGATVVIRDAQGAESTALVTLDAGGFAFVELPAGDYVVEAQPVEGLMGTPAPVAVTVMDGTGTPVALGYDTGIR